jgi:serine O-acetyltransferase
MLEKFKLAAKLPALVNEIVQSYQSDERTRHIDQAHLPSRSEIIDIIYLLLELSYPGYHGRQNLNEYNVTFHVGELLPKLSEKLHEQVFRALSYKRQTEHCDQPKTHPCDEQARRITMEFLDRLPTIRAMLAKDIQAAFDGDPAARNMDEIIMAYPGVLAITVYRFAHELFRTGVPLIPRIMNEWAHAKTGADIHPGARIGHSFFIDHATGVVIGETSDIGENVKLYQGVTLGALSFPKDERGRLIRGQKRHPTVKNNVTIYANATVLGGETVIGEGAVVGASVFLTSSIPDNATVRMKDPELTVRKREAGDTRAETWKLDFQI